MKKILFGIQFICLIFFLLGFLVTFFMANEIREHSRSAITESLAKKVEKSMTLTEELVESPKVQEYLAQHQIEVIKEEIALYRNDTNSYVTNLTTETGVPSSVVVETKNPLKKRLFQKIFGWKKGIKEKFKKSFNGIVLDVQIFLFSNIFAFGAALYLNRKTEGNDRNYYIASTILTLSIILSIAGYLDQNWFFKFLLNDFAGWGYPAGLILLFGWLLFNYHQSKKSA